MQFETVHHQFEYNPGRDRPKRDFAKGHDYSHGAVQQTIRHNVVLEVPNFYGDGDTCVSRLVAQYRGLL